MRFAYHLRGDRPRQKELCNTLMKGARYVGDEIIPIINYNKPASYADGVILLGISGLVDGITNRQLFDDYRRAGKHVILFDKGYIRDGYYRVSINSWQPIGYLNLNKYPDDRLKATGLTVQPYRWPKEDGYVLFDAASQKFCDWHGLGDQRAWAIAMVSKIKEHTSRNVVCRMKTSTGNMKLDRRIPGAIQSLAPLAADLEKAAFVVSYGGNIGWDAVVAGVPHFAIGPSIARSVSQTYWNALEVPVIPTEPDRRRWLSSVCYHQWTLEELAEGYGWPAIRMQLEGIERGQSNGTRRQVSF